MAVISDRKIPHSTSTNGTVDYYTADIISSTDYYPFGMPMPERNFESAAYRFGFTGHEKEDEIANGIYSTKTRLLDVRLGIWRGVDELFTKYPSWSSYHYTLNNPMIYTDPTGMGTVIDGDGIVIEHIDNDDKGVYSFQNEQEWIDKGKTVDGMDPLGWEGYLTSYEKGDKYTYYPVGGLDWDDAIAWRLRQSELGKNEDEIMDKKVKPVVMGLVLFIPPISLTNSATTLITGSDIYENKADAIDYTLSAVDLVTFGLGELFKIPKVANTVSKTIKTGNDVVNKAGTSGSAIKTIYTESVKKHQ